MMHKAGCFILMLAAALFVAAGLFSVLFCATPAFAPIDSLMNPQFGDGYAPSEYLRGLKLFTWEFLGMLHLMCGIQLAFIVRFSLMKRKEAWAWACVLLSAIILVLVDVIYTLLAGKNSFLAITFFFAILFLLPLFMTKDVLNKKVA